MLQVSILIITLNFDLKITLNVVLFKFTLNFNFVIPFKIHILKCPLVFDFENFVKNMFKHVLYNLKLTVFQMFLQKYMYVF